VTERLLEPVFMRNRLYNWLVPPPVWTSANNHGRHCRRRHIGGAHHELLKYSPARLRRRNALLLVAALLFVVPWLAAAQFTVTLPSTSPQRSRPIGQVAKIVPVSAIHEVRNRPRKQLRWLTKDGEMTVTTDHPPK